VVTPATHPAAILTRFERLKPGDACISLITGSLATGPKKAPIAILRSGSLPSS
jgi:hypothetical protein